MIILLLLLLLLLIIIIITLIDISAISIRRMGRGTVKPEGGGASSNYDPMIGGSKVK